MHLRVYKKLGMNDFRGRCYKHFWTPSLGVKTPKSQKVGKSKKINAIKN